jgi:uncharacterized protein
MEKKINEFSDKCIIIKIHDQYPSVKERVSRCWRINKERAEQADYVLAVINGKVEGVYEPSQWYSVTIEDCKKIDCDNKKQPCGRKRFTGKEAGDNIQKKYLKKYIPDWYMRPGPGPIQYTY